MTETVYIFICINPPVCGSHLLLSLNDYLLIFTHPLSSSSITTDRSVWLLPWLCYAITLKLYIYYAVSH